MRWGGGQQSRERTTLQSRYFLVRRVFHRTGGVVMYRGHGTNEAPTRYIIIVLDGLRGLGRWGGEMGWGDGLGRWGVTHGLGPVEPGLRTKSTVRKAHQRQPPTPTNANQRQRSERGGQMTASACASEERIGGGSVAAHLTRLDSAKPIRSCSWKLA